MFILSSPQMRVILSFYLPILLILIYLLQEQTRVLLEYNSAHWYMELYKEPFLAFQKNKNQ
ncbi:MAG: hypothetical protein OXC37_02325 [Bdellovibrionaceae bacterium]|nr:hypothetical protein [Pseudobdellovibrionaceae bacterium]